MDNLKDVTIIDADGNYHCRKILVDLIILACTMIQKIKSLYSNLDTISFWNLKNEIKLLED